MSVYFLINNLQFAFGMIGAIVLVMAAWLTIDAYKLQKDTPNLFRSIGLVLFAVFQTITALNTNNDILAYLSFFVFIIGLVFIIISFVKTTQLAVNAVIVIPAFSLFSQELYVLSTILLFVIAYFSFRQYKREYNQTWIPFSVSFALLGLSSFLHIFYSGINQASILNIVLSIFALAGFGALGFWVWQYMRLRISESFVMISFGVTFILATVITLAFSTILIGRINTETSNNLLTDVKVLDFSIDSMKEEAKAKADIVSRDMDLINAVSKNDVSSIEKFGEMLLDKYKLSFLTITDDQGSVIVRINALSKRGDTLLGERALEEALLKNTTVTIEDSPVEGFSIRSGSPILLKDKIVGTVITGFPLDNVFADRMKKITGLEMLIYKGDKSVSSTVFDSDGRTRLVGENIIDQKIKKNVLDLGSSITTNTEIYGKMFHASFLPLLNSDEKVVGMLSVAKAQQDIMNIANATNRLTLITVIFIMLVLLLPIYFVSKKFDFKQ